MSDELTIFSKIKEIVLDINPEDILNDAREYGLTVTTLKDLAEQPHNYAFIEKLMEKYATLAASYCSASGATSGMGGVATVIALGGVDIANMAAQLYRLNQKMAVLNGFDLENTIHKERAHLIYLKALGFDAAAQTAIRSQLAKAAAENISKTGPSANVTIRLIMEVAKLLGVKLTKNQAVKLVPFLGAALGGGVNYMFAKNAGKKMIVEYKSDYFDRWQANSR